MKKCGLPPQKSSKSTVLYVQHMATSDQGFVLLLTPERCREGGCECVWLFRAGGQPNNNKGPALSLSPVIFQLSEKLLWYWKKVKLKSLTWYVLTTAGCMCNTSKYFLSSHSCSFWKGDSACFYDQWAGCCFSPALCKVRCDAEEAWLTFNLTLYKATREESHFSLFHLINLTSVSNTMTFECVFLCQRWMLLTKHGHWWRDEVCSLRLRTPTTRWPKF